MPLLDDIRLDIGDDGATQRFTDSQIVGFITKAARRVNRRLSLSGTDDEVMVNATGEMYAPTTSASGSLRDILTLQAECLITNRDAVYSVGGGSSDGVSIKDGEQSIDTRQRAAAISDFSDNVANPCNELEQAIMFEKLNRMCGYDVW